MKVTILNDNEETEMANDNQSGTAAASTPSNQEKKRCITTFRINVLVLFGVAFIFLYLIFCMLVGSVDINLDALPNKTINVDEIMKFKVTAVEAFTLMKELLLVLITGVVAVAKDLVD